jgi:hypothetical protein
LRLERKSDADWRVDLIRQTRRDAEERLRSGELDRIDVVFLVDVYG